MNEDIIKDLGKETTITYDTTNEVIDNHWIFLDSVLL